MYKKLNAFLFLFQETKVMSWEGMTFILAHNKITVGGKIGIFPENLV